MFENIEFLLHHSGYKAQGNLKDEINSIQN